MTAQREDMPIPEDLVYRVAPTRSYALLSVFFALFCTLCIFIFLPFSEWVDISKESNLTIRTADVSHFTPPPPVIKEYVLPEPVPEKQEIIRHLTKPRLDVPDKAKPRRLKLPVSLNAVSLDFMGDFSLDFTVLSIEPELAIDRSEDHIVFELSEVDHAPRPVIRYEPVYPSRARRREIEGNVLLSFVVGASGHVGNIIVVDSEPGEIFVKAASQAVEGWRFEPAIKEGHPVSVRLEINLIFEIKDQS